MSNIYTFSKTQIKVLLRGLGFEKVVGLNIGEEPLDASDVANNLNELMKKGFVSSFGGSFVMNEEIRKMAVLLGESQHYVTVRSKKEELPDLCCFLGEKILVCSAQVASPEYFSVYFSESKELFEELLDQGYFPENDETVLFHEDKLSDFEIILFSGIERNEPVPEECSLLLSVDFPDGKFIRIVEYLLCDYIVVFDGDNFERVFYSRSNIEKIFLKLMG